MHVVGVLLHTSSLAVSYARRDGGLFNKMERIILIVQKWTRLYASKIFLYVNNFTTFKWLLSIIIIFCFWKARAFPRKIQPTQRHILLSKVWFAFFRMCFSLNGKYRYSMHLALQIHSQSTHILLVTESQHLTWLLPVLHKVYNLWYRRKDGGGRQWVSQEIRKTYTRKTCTYSRNLEKAMFVLLTSHSLIHFTDFVHYVCTHQKKV